VHAEQPLRRGGRVQAQAEAQAGCCAAAAEAPAPFAPRWMMPEVEEAPAEKRHVSQAGPRAEVGRDPTAQPRAEVAAVRWHGRVRAWHRCRSCWPQGLARQRAPLAPARQALARQALARQAAVRQAAVRQAAVRQAAVRQAAVRQAAVRQAAVREQPRRLLLAELLAAEWRRWLLPRRCQRTLAAARTASWRR
jgi:hypothetical protein